MMRDRTNGRRYSAVLSGETSADFDEREQPEGKRPNLHTECRSVRPGAAGGRARRAAEMARQVHGGEAGGHRIFLFFTFTIKASSSESFSRHTLV